mmetsp:Transcript_821/g.2662  ORF Transcript_821/g.2662 Transcript_821/m.2662 type:complete len:218 (-) Transcript_821:853-1506(-)
MKGRIGSRSALTRACMRASRIMKLVALVSSSSSSAEAPPSSASMMEAACEVDPLASAVVKAPVLFPKGRWSMKGEMSTDVTARPSSARTLTAIRSVTTPSRPSPDTLSYTPTCSASSRVDLPWKPPPTMRVTPRGSPIPVSEPAFGTGRVTRSEGGEEKGTAEAASIGRSLAPVARGSTDPSATKATSPRPASWLRAACWSSTEQRCAMSAEWSVLS